MKVTKSDTRLFGDRKIRYPGVLRTFLRGRGSPLEVSLFQLRRKGWVRERVSGYWCKIKEPPKSVRKGKSLTGAGGG